MIGRPKLPAGTLFGEIEVIVGTRFIRVKAKEFDVPPPGVKTSIDGWTAGPNTP
jgi:hypothetical protein